MSTPIIYPYKMASQSAKKLAQALAAKRVFPQRKFKPKPNHVIINWGNPREPKWADVRGSMPYGGWKNNQISSRIAQDKLATFRMFKEKGISIPEWTTDRKVAEKWARSGLMVVCRKYLNAHSGKGIVLASGSDQIVDAPLYVKYKKKKKEFRVHVFNGEVIDVQQKRRANGAKEEENYSSYIRSHGNGWIFAREDISEPEELRILAIKSVKILGLDFGAVDIVWNESENKCYCLEINTAPGLEGATVTSYAEAILKCTRE